MRQELDSHSQFISWIFISYTEDGSHWGLVCDLCTLTSVFIIAELAGRLEHVLNPVDSSHLSVWQRSRRRRLHSQGEGRRGVQTNHLSATRGPRAFNQAKIFLFWGGGGGVGESLGHQNCLKVFVLAVQSSLREVVETKKTNKQIHLHKQPPFRARK